MKDLEIFDKNGKALHIADVMARFLELKAKVHNCKPNDLNVGYFQKEAYLFQTYWNTDDRKREFGWEQDLKTGEIQR